MQRLTTLKSPGPDRLIQNYINIQSINRAILSELF